MAGNANLSKWDKLRRWVINRHDYFEAQYQNNNFSADAAELGAYRSMYQVMLDLEKQETAVGGPKVPSPQGVGGVKR